MGHFSSQIIIPFSKREPEAHGKGFKGFCSLEKQPAASLFLYILIMKNKKYLLKNNKKILQDNIKLCYTASNMSRQ